MAVRRYRIFWNLLSKDPPGGVAVTADIPDAWTDDLDPTGSTELTVPGLGMFSKPTITAIAAAGDSDAARVEWALKQNFGDSLASAERVDRDGGRVWAVATRPNGQLLARMIVPAGRGVVVAGVLLAPAEASKLAEIERVLETIRAGE